MRERLIVSLLAALAFSASADTSCLCGGAPVVFRLAHSVDGEAWTDDPDEYRLDNVAANPIAQTVVLKAKTEIKYVKLTAVRTLKEGCAATLGRLELVP